MTLRIPKRMEAKRFDLQFSREDHAPLFDRDLRTVFETVKKTFPLLPIPKNKIKDGEDAQNSEGHCHIKSHPVRRKHPPKTEAAANCQL